MIDFNKIGELCMDVINTDRASIENFANIVKKEVVNGLRPSAPDWSEINEKYAWVAMDSDGCLWAYINKPYAKEDDNFWYAFDDVASEMVYLIGRDVINSYDYLWRLCLWNRYELR